MPTELHLALQRHYASQEGLTETWLDGYRVDALREGVVYEVQTRSFWSIRRKLEKLVKKHRVVLVYPIPETKTIVRCDPQTGEELSARRSPKHGRLLDVFAELPSVVQFLRSRKAALEVVMTVERELRCDDGRGSWRRKGVSLAGRELVRIRSVHRFEKPADLLTFLPPELPETFTVVELRQHLPIKPWEAGKIAYTLREVRAIKHIGKRGNAFLYCRNGRRKAKQ